MASAGLRTALCCSIVGLLACVPSDPLAANKALARRYLEEALSQGDAATVAEVFPDSGFVLNGRLLRPADLGAMRQHLLERFPDFHLVIEDQIAEGDRVVTRVTFHGTHSAEYQGIPPSGRRVSWGGIAIDRVENGKVIEGWHQADDWALLRQLGAKIRR